MRTKDTFYFPHDYEPTSDPKIQALVGEHGASGYGIYWRIVEMLHSDQFHKLPHKEYIYLAIAKQMLTSAEQNQAIINYCITPCELLQSDGKFFWSERVLRNIEERAKLSEIRAIAGRAGAIAKQKLAKPSKGKERKVNKEDIENTYINFYESELSQTDDENYHTFVKWLLGENEIGRSFEKCLKLKDQIGYKQFCLLKDLSKEHGTKISDKVRDLENKFDKYKPKSFSLTLINWMKRT